jgi:hypothetical protein
MLELAIALPIAEAVIICQTSYPILLGGETTTNALTLVDQDLRNWHNAIA